MKVTRIQDRHNPDKVWIVKKYLCGTYYVNQEIKGQKFYGRDRRMSKRMLASIGILDWQGKKEERNGRGQHQKTV